MSAQGAFAAALLAPDAPAPQGLVAWNGSDPAQRFAVYRNNVVVSLVDALAAKFPVVAELVGEDFFRAMARAYVLGCPPRSRMLALYGEDFADFIAGFPPAADLPYLADVARLEGARLVAWHAADDEPLGAAAFALVAPGRLAAMRVALHSATRVLRFAHAAVSIWAAHQGKGDLSALDPFTAEDALVTRPRLDVEIRLLAPGEAELFAALAEGETLAAAAARALTAAPGMDMDQAMARLVTSGVAIELNFTGEAP